jgi:hypothetical protein
MKSSGMVYLALAFASNSGFLLLRASQQQQQGLHSHPPARATKIAT